MEVGEHVGTHFDAPCHWISGRDRPCVDGLDADQFIGPAVVIDVTAEVADDADCRRHARDDRKLGSGARPHSPRLVGDSPNGLGFAGQ